jgi:hypothetical protein
MTMGAPSVVARGGVKGAAFTLLVGFARGGAKSATLTLLVRSGVDNPYSGGKIYALFLMIPSLSVWFNFI